MLPLASPIGLVAWHVYRPRSESATSATTRMFFLPEDSTDTLCVALTGALSLYHRTEALGLACTTHSSSR